MAEQEEGILCSVVFGPAGPLPMQKIAISAARNCQPYHGCARDVCISEQFIGRLTVAARA